MKGRIFALQPKDVGMDQLTGTGSKGVLVVISAAEASEKTLFDLLKAIQHDATADVYTLVVQQPTPIQLNEVISSGNITKIVSFGYGPSELGFHINEVNYHPYQIGDLTAIFSESIAVLNSDKTKKIALWQALQHVFLNQ